MEICASWVTGLPLTLYCSLIFMMIPFFPTMELMTFIVFFHVSDFCKKNEINKEKTKKKFKKKIKKKLIKIFNLSDFSSCPRVDLIGVDGVHGQFQMFQHGDLEDEIRDHEIRLIIKEARDISRISIFL